MPGVVTDPGAFVVVGMAGFFSGVSNTPISTIIFVSEMTQSYGLLLPSMLVCTLCYLASQHWTIYDKQVKNRLASPVHRGDFFVDILQTIKVKELMHRVKKVAMIPQNMPFAEFKEYFSESDQHYFPVMDENNRLRSIFSINDVRGVLFSPEIELLVVMKDIGTSDIIFTTPNDDLNSVLKKMTVKNIDSLPVVNQEDHQNLIGMLNRREVIAFYNDQIQKMKTVNGNSDDRDEEAENP
jgi:CIC family chloride channel protein